MNETFTLIMKTLRGHKEGIFKWLMEKILVSFEKVQQLGIKIRLRLDTVKRSF